MYRSLVFLLSAAILLFFSSSLVTAQIRLPRSEGWANLQFPCTDTAPGPPDEFHPLRPYPGSPCDPQIPGRAEYESGQGQNLYNCGKSLNATGSYRYRITYTCNEYLALPNAPSVPQYGVPYKCIPDSTCDIPQICIWERPNMNVSIDLSGAMLPIIGNTQDPMDDATKVNNYLEWYLAGTTPTWLEDQSQPGSGSENPAIYQCMGQSLAKYMNDVIAGVGSLPHINLVSPAFNLTNPAEVDIFNAMVAAGANFSALDNFAGNTYSSIPGSTTPAYDWYAAVRTAGQTWRQRFLLNGAKPVIFTEFGDFRTFGQNPEIPNPDPIVSAMASEFSRTAADSTTAGISYFNAFGGNPQFIGHQLGDVVSQPSDNELRQITSSNPAKGGVNSARVIDLSGGFAGRVTQSGNNLVWAVEIITGPSDPVAFANYLNAFPASVKPVLRLCFGTSCGFANSTGLVSFLTSVAPHLTRDIWVIAGPNEPATETWASTSCGATFGGSVDPFLTFAGPIRKLLSWDTQNLMRLAIGGWPVGVNFLGYHDYRVDTSNTRMSQAPSDLSFLFDPTSAWARLFPRIPLATLEDVVGEVTISRITNQAQNAGCLPGNPPSDPANPYSPCKNWNQTEGVYLPAPGLNMPNPLPHFTMNIQVLGNPNDPIAGSDGRLYLPHLKSSTALAQILAATHRPFDGTIASNCYVNPDTIARLTHPIVCSAGTGVHPQGPPERIAQYAGRHMSLPFRDIGVGEIVEPDWSVPVEKLVNEGGWVDGRATRNTELLEGYPAPSPLFDLDNPTVYNLTCDINEVRWNPGDNLMANTPITARLGYTQRIQFIPTISGPTAPGACLPDWTSGCDASSIPCCSGDCSFIDLPPNLPANYYCRGVGNKYQDFPTEGRVAVFVKSPYIDNVYDHAVADEASVLRRWMPAFPTPTPCPPFFPCEPDPGIRTGDATFPAVSSVSYSAGPASSLEPRSPSGDASRPTNPQAGSGSTGLGDPNSNGQAEIYFGRLGSLFDYMLGASPLPVIFNLQDAFSPLQFNPRAQ